jgi:hypothetical protein
MRFPKRPSDADPAAEQDPLSPYSAPTVRRTVDSGGAQSLDEGAGGAARNSDTQVGTDFSTRNFQRRLRQGSARVYPQRFSDMARKVDNRQLFLLGGGLILLLVALLAWQAYQRNQDTPTGLDLAGETQPTPLSEPQATAGLAPPPAGAIVTAGPGDFIDNAPAATAAPPAATGAMFVVAGTGTEGLFLRPEPSTNTTPITTLPEGTKVEAIGPEQNDGTYTWKRVKTDAGAEGWVAAQFLVPAP